MRNFACVTRVVVGALFLTAPLALAQTPALEVAEPAPMADEAPPCLPLLPKDEVFDIRIALLPFAKRFAFIEGEFARDPRAHVKARYAEYLLGGERWGAPPGSADTGMAVAQTALLEGSQLAHQVVGWQLLTGRNVPREPGRGYSLIQRAAQGGNIDAMLAMGDVSLRGLLGAVSLDAATYWYRRAAYMGVPEGLEELAAAYEKGKVGKGPDLPMACAFYYESAIHGSRSAGLRLKELAKTLNAHAVRAADLVTLWYGSYGALDLRTPRVKEAALRLEAISQKDPVILVALGRLQQSGQFGFWDAKKAYALFDEATALGSAEGRCERAVLLAGGRGVKADPAQALAEWRALIQQQHLPAHGWLGYYQHWDTLKGTDLKKDAALAFAASKRAAEAGDTQGQINVARAYEFGIGVETNYALAARYYRVVGRRGWTEGGHKMKKLLDHVPR